MKPDPWAETKKYLQMPIDKARATLRKMIEETSGSREEYAASPNAYAKLQGDEATLITEYEGLVEDMEKFVTRFIELYQSSSDHLKRLDDFVQHNLDEYMRSQSDGSKDSIDQDAVTPESDESRNTMNDPLQQVEKSLKRQEEILNNRKSFVDVILWRTNGITNMLSDVERRFHALHKAYERNTLGRV